ncbi:hypothetical protein [Rhodanobacter sp. DHB23]|uniref:hypothetical protein n=1 Tax=Rhodanobacter sp. DHB23 TaxID=2775923 RepID=UPI00177E7D8E|nr:hypothetical protein [Rhodanobacter sp. DHB23]MBD8872475.1 hypothetical protein [Rhodanobacter sp. DHB23]
MSNISLLQDFNYERGVRIWPARNENCRRTECEICDAEKIEGEGLKLAPEDGCIVLFRWLDTSQWVQVLEDRAWCVDENDGEGDTLMSWLGLDDFAAMILEFCSTCMGMPELKSAIERWRAQGATLVFIGARPARTFMFEQRITELESCVQQGVGWNIVEDLMKRLEALEKAQQNFSCSSAPCPKLH